MSNKASNIGSQATAKEQWQNDVLNSLDDIQRAIPDEILLSQIMARLPENTLTTKMPRWQLRWAVAAACLLVAVNLYVLNTVDHTWQTGMVKAQASLSGQASDNIPLFTDYSLYESME